MVRRTRKSNADQMENTISVVNHFTPLSVPVLVMNGTAYKTTYGAVKPKGDALTKAHLKYNKNGRIVSKSKSSRKGQLLAQLRRAGYTTQKGKFGAVKINGRRTRKKRRTKKKGKRCRHKTGRMKGKFKKC